MRRCLFPQAVMLTGFRKLYHILGEIISSLYGQNIGCNKHLTISTVLERIVKVEQLLMAWRRGLPPELQLKPWTGSSTEADGSSLFDRLSIIITLRYLNARILLHRPVLARFLDHVGNRAADPDECDFLYQLGQSNLQVCIDSASEIIAIVHNVETRPYLLGAWWFSAYYSECIQVGVIKWL